MKRLKGRALVSCLLAAVAGADALSGEVGGVGEVAGGLRGREGCLGLREGQAAHGGGCGEDCRKGDERESVHKT